MSSTNHPLTQGDGYGVVLGFGAAFALGMIGTTFCLQRYHKEATDSSEGFSTANRKMKTGLIASAVVSSWTWAATLLQSSSVAYSYGISGPFWYASGATVQIILFCVIAIELKRRAPFAHTFLEVIRARYDRAGHLVFIVFCLCTNILVTAMLLTGGSAVVHSLSGMHIAAACFLLPLGTIVYTMFGGIKATFLTDYVHTVAVLIIILFFAFTTYTSPALLGSTSKVYDLLVNASHRHPVQGNAQDHIYRCDQRVIEPARHEDGGPGRIVVDAFGVIAGFNCFDGLQGREIDNRNGAAVLVGDEGLGVGDGDGIGAAANGDGGDDRAAREADNADVVAADVGRIGAVTGCIDRDAEGACADLDFGDAGVGGSVDDGDGIAVAVGG